MHSVDSSSFRHVLLPSGRRCQLPGKSHDRKFTAAMAIPTPKSTPASTRFEPPSPTAKVRPATTMATRERPRAIVLVKACCSTLTAFSQGEVPVWPKAGPARNRTTTAVVRKRKRNIEEGKRLQRDMFTGMPPPQIGNANHDSEGRPWRPPGQVVGLRAMRESAVHATWPRSVSRRSWSFSPINSVVPRSRSPLPQAVRDAERRTGEPGVALLAGVRGENSPHYTKRPPERKNSMEMFVRGAVSNVAALRP